MPLHNFYALINDDPDEFVRQVELDPEASHFFQETLGGDRDKLLEHARQSAGLLEAAFQPSLEELEKAWMELLSTPEGRARLYDSAHS